MNGAANKKRAHFLRLVEPQPEAPSLTPSKLLRFGWQNTLFAAHHPSLMAVIDLEGLEASEFVTLVTNTKPKLLFDLRRAPRFDKANLNRARVVDLLRESDTRYFDLSSQAHATDTSSVGAAVRRLTDDINRLSGPVLFLVDRDQLAESYVLDLIDKLPAPPDDIWDVLKLPFAVPVAADAGKRSLIFISHANPEDNGFATWLASKLAIAGYEVWSDVTKLIGGEFIWNDIEDAVRNHAAKVVVVLSRVSQSKAGVLDEVDLAIRVERSQNMSSFVIPVRMDELPFSEIRANLARKNVIDFNRNWTGGLSALLKALQRDGVRRIAGSGASTLARCLEGVRARGTAVEKSETLVANWLPIIHMPDRVDLFDVDAAISDIPRVAGEMPAPNFSYLRLVGAMGISADQLEVGGRSLKRKYSIPVSEFLAGRPEALPGLNKREASNHIASLIRQAWNTLLEKRGLTPFEMASGVLAWFPADKLIEGNKVTFVDDQQKRRRKQLVGWSEKRKIFWHAGFEAKPVMADPVRILLRPHVVFTEDGKTPLFSKQRMHVLRRSFCKSWWNDRWRDLFLAYVEMLSEQERISLPAGAAEFVFGSPIRMLSTYSPSSEDATADDDIDVADPLDMDDEILDDSFEQAGEIAELEGGGDESAG